jgi:hypothetical protein
MNLCKLLLAAVGATVLLGALVANTSARNFSVSEQHIRASVSRLEFHFPELTTSCHITLEGSLHTRTIAKTAGSLIGYITSAILGPCPSITATVLRETLPWHIRYSGFEGTLPAITSDRVHIINAAWRIRESGGVTCLARSTAAEPVVSRFHIDASGHATAGIEGSIRTGFECLGIAGSFRSDSPQLLGSATQTAVSVRLI